MNKVATITSTESEHYDPYLSSFIRGICETTPMWEQNTLINNTMVIRGLGGASQRAIKLCWKTNYSFFAIDTGYFGNNKNKIWHRITYNALQNINTLIKLPTDRFEIQLKKTFTEIYKPFTPGRKILICPPSDKVMSLFGQGNAKEWTNRVVRQLVTLTDRPIEIRLKPIRRDRISTSTIQQALSDDVHCLITYNSIAATEALMEGKPAITLGPNAAQLICETNLLNIETPKIPSRSQVYMFLMHLSYSQFSQEEMNNGTAWRILQDMQI